MEVLHDCGSLDFIGRSVESSIDDLTTFYTFLKLFLFDHNLESVGAMLLQCHSPPLAK